MNLVKLQKIWQREPLRFIKDIFGEHYLWEKQIETIFSVRDNKNTLVKSAHGVGKTHIAALVALWFLMSFTNSVIITTAPSYPQVEKLLWAEINNLIKNAKIPIGLSALKTECRFNDKWYALGVSPKIENEDQGKRITGFHSETGYNLIVFDEGPSVKQIFWELKEVLMTGAYCRFLAIGNPIGEGPFKEAFKNTRNSRIDMSIFDSPNFKANGVLDLEELIKLSNMDDDERDHLFSRFVYPAPYLTTPSWAVDRLKEWSYDSPLFEARVLGVFPSKTTDTIISYSECETAQHLDVHTKHINTLGVDVARFGDDLTVIIGYKQGRQDIKDKFQGQDLVKTANVVKHHIVHGDYRTIVIDDTGVGGGLTDILRNSYLPQGTRIIPVNFAQAASKDGIYDGIVTEMYFNARDHIREGNIQLVDNGSLFSDLSSRKYVFDNKGRYKIEKKADFKKRMGHSPDEGDAFVLCVHGMFVNRESSLILGGETMIPEELL